MDNSWGIIDDYIYRVNSQKVFGKMINQIEKIVITKALTRSDGNQMQAAKILGLHRNTLHNKIKKYNIDIRSFKR